VVPLHLLIGALLGCLQGEQHKVIEYLREENRVLKRSCRTTFCGSPTTTDGAWPLVARLSVVGYWRRWRPS